MSCFPCSTRKFIVGRISYRKIYSIAMERKIIICLFLGRLIIAICGQTPILEIFDSDTAEGTEQGSSFTLNCTVTINDIILFKLNDTMQGSCTAPFAGFPGSCIPNTITQSLATSVSSWTISPAEPAHHGFWKCTRGSTDSIAEFLNIYKLPSTIDSQSGISSNIIVNDTSSYPILVDVDCMFSQSGPRMELQFVDGGTSSASVIMSCTTLSTACSPCTGCSAYSCRHTVKLKQDLSSGEIKTNTPYTLRINVGVTGTTQTFSNNVFAPHTITFTRTSPISEMSTSIATDRMTSINSISEFSNTTLPMISGSTTATSIETSNFDSNHQSDEIQTKTLRIVSNYMSTYQRMFATTTDISKSFKIPIQIMTETFTMTGYTISSYNEIISPSTFETITVFPQIVSKISISLSVDTHSEKILHTTRVSAGSLIISDSSKYSILSMTISPSYIGDSNIPSLITLFSVPSLTSVATDSAFEITNASRVSNFSLTTEAVITHKTTATVDSSAVNTVLNSTKSESLLLSISENNSRIQQESESFLWSILEINSRIQHIDTNTESPLMSTTLNDHITYSSKIEELSFSSYQDFSETSVTLSEISVSSQLSSSIIDTIDNLIYTTKTLITSYLADTRHSLVSVVQPLSLDYAASSSTFLPYFIQSMYHDSSLQTTEYYATIQTEFTSHVTTSIYKSNTDNATTEIYSKRKLISAQPYMHTSVMPSQTQRASMNYIQDSTNHFQSTTDVVYSSKISEYALSTLHSTSFFNTNAIASRVHSSMKTTNKMIFETQSGMLTNSTFLSDFETTRLTKTIDFSNETIISMINPSSQQKSTDKSYIEIDTSFKDSLFSSSHCCGSIKANYLGLTTLSFKVFESMSTTPTSTVQSGLSEKNKIIIFISTSSAVFSIIVVIILIGYIRMNLSKHIEKPRNEDGDISWSNSSSPSKRVCPDYSFTGKSIYPFVNTSSSSFKMFPYEHNWNDIV